ncbi:hypothetical protein D3C81_1028130 [compost metagenome]
MDVRRPQAPGLHAGIRQPAGKTVADRRQRLLGRLAAACGRGGGRVAVDDHAYASHLAAPWQARHRGVLEQTTGLRNRAQVVRKEAQVELAERAALSTWLQIARQGMQIVVPACFVLRVELDHPGVVVQLVKRVLQGVFERIARLPQPSQLAALGADRLQLEEGRHRLPVLQQHGLRAGQVLHPGQQVRERRRHVVQRCVVGLGRGPALTAECAARLVNALCGQRRHMAFPGIVGFLSGGSGGCGSLARPWRRPGHQ